MHIMFSGKVRRQDTARENLDICGRITFNWILEKQDGMVWTGFVWLRIGTSGVLL
jgi:hypothetical protein